MKCRLIGKSRKGKNRLSDLKARVPSWDGIWEVALEQARVGFSSLAGPWLLVTPALDAAVQRDLGAEAIERMSRWVHSERDFDFDVQLGVR